MRTEINSLMKTVFVLYRVRKWKKFSVLCMRRKEASTLIRKKKWKARKNSTAKFLHQFQKFLYARVNDFGWNLFEVTTHGSFTLKFRVENRLSASSSDWRMTQKVQSDKNFVSRNLSGTRTFPYLAPDCTLGEKVIDQVPRVCSFQFFICYQTFS